MKNINDTLDQYHKFRQALYYYDDKRGTGVGYRNGNIRATEIKFDNDSSVYYEYLYDGLDRLIIAEHNDIAAYPIEVFKYDKNGNIDTVIWHDRGVSDTTVYEYETGTNQLARLSGNEVDTFTYDSNGNLESDSSKNATYYYSYLNRLDKIVVPNTWGNEHLYMGYNSSGLRISKSLVWNYRDTCGIGGIESFGNGIYGGVKPPPIELCTYWDTTHTRYLRSFGNTLKEINEYGQHPTWYILAGDDRIATIDENGNLYYYLKDHLGTTRMTIRDNGTVYGRYYRYLAFGETESEQITLNQAYKYTGKPFDSELGLDIYYYGARYYNPHLGRWLAVDPLHDKYPSLSPYVYCSDNPMKYVDPDGNWVYVPSGNGLTGTAIEMSRSGELGNIMQSMIFQLDIHSGQSFNIMVDNKFVKQDDS